MVLRFLIPPRVVFILLWVKKGNAYEFFSHVNSQHCCESAVK